MDVPVLIREALKVLNVDQAELARRLEVSQSAVSKWISGQGKPDYESCLRLALLTGWAPADVLKSAGRDPSLLPGDPTEKNTVRAEVLRYKRVIGELRRLLATSSPLRVGVV